MTKFYYDGEFLEDGRTIELISFGFVSDTGREYYAVNSDAPMDRILADDWLVRNVLPALPLTGRKTLDTYLEHPTNSYPKPSLAFVKLDATDSRVKPRWVIANEVRDFLLADGDDIELWAWYGAYDHVALAQLWGRMISLPKGIPMWTNDLRQEVHRLGNPQLPRQAAGEHNALEDARWLRDAAAWLAEQDPATQSRPQ